MKKSLVIGSTLYLALLGTYLLYTPGFGGIFLLDDNQNLQLLNRYNGVTDWQSFKGFVFNNESGALGRPVSMASFLINDNAYPGEAGSYRYTNTLIHLLCGIAVFIFCRLLAVSLSINTTHANILGLVVTGWWLILALHASTTLYVIQRMTILSALFVIVGVSSYLYGRLKLAHTKPHGWFWILFALGIPGSLAVLSKENGILIFPLILACEFSLNKASPIAGSRLIKIICSIPCALLILYLIYKIPSFERNYLNREFSFSERVLTEPRILWHYISQILVPRLSSMGLFHDDIVLSTGIFTPFSTILSLLAHIVVIFGAFFFRNRYPFLLIGICWFYIAHSLESSFLPLELYFEHRNYLPSIGILTALVFTGYTLKKYLKISIPILALLLLMNAFGTQQRAQLWSNPDNLFHTWALEKPESYRAQMSYASSLLVRRQIENGISQLQQISNKWPDRASPYLAIYSQQCSHIKDEGQIIKLSAVDFSKLIYSGDLIAATDNLMNSYRKGKCSYLDSRNMEFILQQVLLVNKSGNLFHAQVYFYLSEVYTNQGNLGKAVNAIEMAYKNQSDSYLLYLKSTLLNSAGLTEEAMIEIDRAIAAESAKPLQKQVNIELFSLHKEKLQQSTNQK